MRNYYGDTFDIANAANPAKLRGWKIGQRVIVKRCGGHARIECFYADISGGVRLDKKVAGFVSWNVADLKRA